MMWYIRLMHQSTGAPLGGGGHGEKCSRTKVQKWTMASPTDPAHNDAGIYGFLCENVAKCGHFSDLV